MVQFRPATVEDYPAICNLVTTPQESFLIWPAGCYPWTVEQLETLAQQRCELTVVMDGDQLIGFANLYDYVANRYAFIGNVVIHQNYRGRGLGRQLVAHMLVLAFDQHRLREVRISVFADNAPALLLYGRLGFAPYAMEERKDTLGRPVALIHLRTGRAEQSASL